MLKNFFSYLKNITAALLVSALLTPQLLLAAPFTFDSFNTSPGDQDAGGPTRANLGVRQLEQQSSQALRQQRQQIDRDTAECKPQSPGRGLVGNLSNIISRGIQRNLSQLIERTIGQASGNLSGMIQQSMSQALPQTLERGLRQRLPVALGREMRNTGVSELTPQIFQTVLTQVLREIIRADLERDLETSLRGQLRNQVNSEVQEMLWNTQGSGGQLESTEWNSPILDNDPIFQNNLQLIFGENSQLSALFGPEQFLPPDGQMFQVVQQMVEANAEQMMESLLTTGRISLPSPQNIIGQMGALIEIVAGQMLQAVETLFADLVVRMQNAVAAESARGASQSAGIDALVQQILPVIMQLVLNGTAGQGGQAGLMDQFNGLNFSSNVYSNIGGTYGASGQSFNQWAGNDILGAAGFDFRPLSQALADQIGRSMTSGLSLSNYDDAVRNLATMGWNGQGQLDANTINLASGLNYNGANYLGGLAAAGYQVPLNSETVQMANAGQISLGPTQLAPPPSYQALSGGAWHAANPDFAGPPSPADIIGADAGAAVSSNASNIGNNIGGALGLENLGNQLASDVRGAFVGGISGMVGNLVDGVPYVGGLLSPIAERITETALNAVLMPITGEIIGGGIMTDDPQTHGRLDEVSSNVISGAKAVTKATTKPLWQIVGLDEQLVEQSQEELKKLEEIKDREFRNCMTNKKTSHATRSLEEILLVKNPIARGRAGEQIIAQGEQLRQALQTAATNRTGDPTQTTVDLQQNLADARREGFLLTAYRLRDDPSPGMTRMRQELVRAADGISGPYVPQDADSLPLQDRIRIWNMADHLVAERQEQEEREFAVYGRNSKRECRGNLVQFETYTICDGRWVVITPGDLFASAEQAQVNAPLQYALGTHSYGGDQYLSQMFQYGNNQLFGGGDPYGGYSSGSVLTTSEIFSQGLEQALATGLDNNINQLFSQAGMSVNQFSGQLASRFNSRQFRQSDFSRGGNNFPLEDLIHGALQNTPGSGALGNNEISQIIQAIVTIILNAVLGPNT